MAETDSKECAAKSDEPAFDEAGVDLTLIRWMLSLTPGERLDVFQKAVNSIREKQRTGEEPGQDKDEIPLAVFHAALYEQRKLKG